MGTMTKLMAVTSFFLLSAAAEAGHSEVSTINSARGRRGVHALRLDAKLDAVAKARASRMAANSYHGHVSGSYSPGRAEGVAWSSHNPAGIMNACYTMSRNFKYVGAACVKGRNGYYFSVVYR
jgi:uncharacterized protein YkwD